MRVEKRWYPTSPGMSTEDEGPGCVPLGHIGVSKSTSLASAIKEVDSVKGLPQGRRIIAGGVDVVSFFGPWSSEGKHDARAFWLGMQRGRGGTTSRSRQSLATGAAEMEEVAHTGQAVTPTSSASGTSEPEIPGPGKVTLLL